MSHLHARTSWRHHFGPESGPSRALVHMSGSGAAEHVMAMRRLSERRWRLVLPAPRFESMLDIIEITPAR